MDKRNKLNMLMKNSMFHKAYFTSFARIWTSKKKSSGSQMSLIVIVFYLVTLEKGCPGSRGKASSNSVPLRLAIDESINYQTKTILGVTTSQKENTT